MMVNQERRDVVVAGIDYYLRNRLPVRLGENLDWLLPVGANNFKVDAKVDCNDVVVNIALHVTFDEGLGERVLDLVAELDLRAILTDEALVDIDLRMAATGVAIVAIDAKLRQATARG